MKHLIILGDGMADEPIESLSGKTPMQYANTPYMDLLAYKGVTGRIKSVPDGFPPGSEVANISILGYDLNEVYEGRGVLEAAGIGVSLEPGDMAMRCNLISIDGGIIKDHTAGHISTEEADELISFLNDNLATDGIRLYRGVSYKHLLVIKGGDKQIICTPPHDAHLRPFKPLLVKPKQHEAADTSKLLNELIVKSQDILKNHPINLLRIEEGKSPANSIWPWSPGYRPQMEHMQSMYGFNKGAVISAVDLIHGIALYAGLDVLHVDGATGLYDTNYEGKAKAALEALHDYDFVFLHVEASDDAGHEGNVALKVKTIEYLDQRLVRLIYEGLESLGEPVAIAILPDHPTPCLTRTHTNSPVPFLIYKPGAIADRVNKFDEFSVMDGKYGILEKDQFIHEFFND